MYKRFSLRAGLAMMLSALLVLAMFGTLRARSPSQAATIAPEVLAATADGAKTDVLVVLAEQADLNGAREVPNPEARRRAVYDRLRTTALRSQADLRRTLENQGVDYRPFYVVNMIALQGDRDLLTRLAARREVARIAANPRVRQRLPEPTPEELTPQAAAGVEWNVAQVGADGVWALGYTGEGVVVAGQDTGYDWDHPALVDQYRGSDGVTVTHDYNWHDAIHEDITDTAAGNPCGFDLSAPCDDVGHGTHTMGTIVGDDRNGNQVGVAPGAKWIGCRNMEEGVGTPATYAECFEFFLAPYPVGGDPFQDGQPSLAPHVINNSWTCPPYEGCDWRTLQTVVENVRAAGIMVVASAGNEGYLGCSTVRNPPAIYDAVFSVGATDATGAIAGFSSRGPVSVDGSGRLKPDVSAPGVGVRSSIPGTGYARFSGTSMAGPHVAGAAALLWSAAPQLLGDVDATEAVIAHAARPRTTTEGCGGDGPNDVPNNVYGWGGLDALAAVERTLSRAQVAKRVCLPEGFQVRALDYTLAVTNTASHTLTEVVLTDRLPPSTTLIRASGRYTEAGGWVTWTAKSLGPWETLTTTFQASVENVPKGARVINADYEVRARELLTPVVGTPVAVTIPWRSLLFPIFKGWQAEGSREG
jgi:serine protease AprX